MWLFFLTFSDTSSFLLRVKGSNAPEKVEIILTEQSEKSPTNSRVPGVTESSSGSPQTQADGDCVSMFTKGLAS